MFDILVCLELNKVYKVKLFVIGLNLCYGDKGKIFVDCEGVRFEFCEGGDNNGMFVKWG